MYIRRTIPVLFAEQARMTAVCQTAQLTRPMKNIQRTYDQPNPASSKGLNPLWPISLVTVSTILSQPRYLIDITLAKSRLNDSTTNWI